MKISECKKGDVMVMFCAPYPEFAIPPPDYSKAALRECPSCKKSMWFTEKKEAILDAAKKKRMKILLECFNCFESRLSDPKEREMFLDCMEIKI